MGLALEAAKTLQPGETLLVSKPLAAVTRSAEAAAALAAEAEESSSSSGSWVVPLDEEIEAVADELAGGNGKSLVGAHAEQCFPVSSCSSYICCVVHAVCQQLSLTWRMQAAYKAMGQLS